jgi:RimJ/RimL family protein N-acetyltransferase
VRDWRRSDKLSLLRFANNRNVWRNLTHLFPHPYTDVDAEAWFTLLERTTEPTHWAIEVDGSAVGGIGVTRREGIFAKTAELGYWLGEPYWGRGLMTEVVTAVSRHALEHYGLVRLESPVFAWNPASMRVLEKSGFVREGIARASAFKDEQVIDTVVYALVKRT